MHCGAACCRVPSRCVRNANVRVARLRMQAEQRYGARGGPRWGEVISQQTHNDYNCHRFAATCAFAVGKLD